MDVSFAVIDTFFKCSYLRTFNAFTGCGKCRFKISFFVIQLFGILFRVYFIDSKYEKRFFVSHVALSLFGRVMIMLDVPVQSSFISVISIYNKVGLQLIFLKEKRKTNVTQSKRLVNKVADGNAFYCLIVPYFGS